jgi:hemin uptake protein HemP
MQLRVSRNSIFGGGEKRMNQPPRAARVSDAETDRPDSGTPVVDSITLMSGRRELIIRHGADSYRLRVTASNKLILTK